MRAQLAFARGGGARAACGGSEASPPGGRRRRRRPGGRRRPQRGPVPVEVVLVRSDTVVDAITATGQIEPLQSIELRPEVDGRLVEILVREGAAGGPGHAALQGGRRASSRPRSPGPQADRDLAQQALTRTRALLADKAAAPADVERAEAQMRSTQAGLDLLQLRLDRTVVRAPFTGVTGQRLASLGDYVNNSTRLITLQTVQSPARRVPGAGALRRPAQARAAGAVPGGRAGGARLHRHVDFVDPAGPAPRPHHHHQGPGAEPAARAAGRACSSRPGWRPPSARPPLVIPEDAVSPFAGAMYVWVIRDGKAERREVTLGVRTPGYVEVAERLDPGEQVVVGGPERLSPGADVRATVVDRHAP